MKTDRFARRIVRDDHTGAKALAPPMNNNDRNAANWSICGSWII
jgi:hypothetical protein